MQKNVWCRPLGLRNCTGGNSSPLRRLTRREPIAQYMGLRCLPPHSLDRILRDRVPVILKRFSNAQSFLLFVITVITKNDTIYNAIYGSFIPRKTTSRLYAIKAYTCSGDIDDTSYNLMLVLIFSVMFASHKSIVTGDIYSRSYTIASGMVSFFQQHRVLCGTLNLAINFSQFTTKSTHITLLLNNSTYTQNSKLYNHS